MDPQAVGHVRIEPIAVKPERIRRGSCGGTTKLPEGKQWVPHVGKRQQRRELKRSWRAFEKKCKTSPEHARARGELLDAVIGVVSSKDEEIACHIAVHGSTVRTRDTGKPFLTLLDRAVDEMLATPRVSKSWTDGAPPA